MRPKHQTLDSRPRAKRAHRPLALASKEKTSCDSNGPSQEGSQNCYEKNGKINEKELKKTRIDINGINELVENVNIRMNNKTVDAEDLFYTISSLISCVGNLKDKTNKLIKAVKQLDKKINKKD